jgi:hypothetical protein
VKYTLIKGFYHVVMQSPDADSVKFRAANDSLWQRIDTDNREVFERQLAEGAGVVTLRLQGVDALETHYSPPSLPAPADVKTLKTTLTPPSAGSFKQLPAFGQLSSDKLLELLGVTAVKWRQSGYAKYITEARINGVLVKEKLKDNLPGYIVAGDVEMNGRPIVWMFAGTTTLKDGTAVTNEQLVEMLEQSVNYQMLRLGMVYPLYFMTLSGKLRDKLSAAVREAQAAAQKAAAANNIWAIDQTTKGMTLSSLKILTDEKALYPYLFRKVIKHYYRSQMEAYWNAVRANASSVPTVDSVNLDGFFRDANPYVFIISDQDFVRLADVMEVSGSKIKMKKSPHDLVFLS